MHLGIFSKKSSYKNDERYRIVDLIQQIYVNRRESEDYLDMLHDKLFLIEQYVTKINLPSELRKEISEAKKYYNECAKEDKKRKDKKRKVEDEWFRIFHAEAHNIKPLK